MRGTNNGELESSDVFSPASQFCRDVLPRPMEAWMRKLAIAASVAFASLPAFAAAAPLHEAARQGQTDVAESLIEDGADVEALDESGATPLVAAALAGQTNLVTVLLEHGADPSGRDAGGFTALHAAAHMGHLDIVELLVDRGVDIDDQKNKAKLSPLHAAAEQNYLEIARFLLDHGAKVGLVESSGWTPIMRATFRSYPDMVRLLREYGATCSDKATVEFLNYCMNAGK